MFNLIDTCNPWAWMKANPLVAWPLITALVTAILKPRSPARYAAMTAMYPTWLWSRFAPLLQLIGALGLDPVKALQVISKVFTGKQNSGAKVIAVIFFAFCIVPTAQGCVTNDDAKAALYSTTLEECNRTAATLCESITCENRARASNNRKPRAMPTSCVGTDGGIKDGAAHE